ncbi:MAG: HAD family phosphatase, partial [Synergistaceae bacterium]|jgi:HAD superfamily hydrolase (TIGR01509 family)|nr:HAD family phosphatase [Synergistaceae bacterium]
VKAYIFDLDGTLLDSTGLWERIDADFLSKRGIPAPEDYAPAVAAMSFREGAEYTIARFNLPDTADALCREWYGMALYAYGHTVRLKPNVREYLAALKSRGMKLGVATSSTFQLYDAALRNLGILSFFDAICSADEVEYGKSRPDIFILAAKKLGVSPSDCVVFEDVLRAVQSAKSAGMTVYGVYDEASKADWERIKATADGAFADFKDAPPPE